MIYAILFFTLLIGVYFVGRKLKRNLLPEIIIGFLLGLNWEIYSAHEWIYNSSKFIMINVGIETIPLDVVIAWSASMTTTILLVYEVMKFFKLKSKFAFLIIGWFALFFVGLVIELVGYYFNFWNYAVKFDLYFWPSALPLRIIFGWITIGTCNLATINFYRDFVENKIKLLPIVH